MRTCLKTPNKVTQGLKYYNRRPFCENERWKMGRKLILMTFRNSNGVFDQVPVFQYTS